MRLIGCLSKGLLIAAFGVLSLSIQANAAGFNTESLTPKWHGSYFGAHIGYGEAAYDGIFDNEGDEGFPSDLNLDGVLGGVYLGYNWVHQNILFGVEGDLTLTNFADSASDRDGGQDDLVKGDIDFLGSIRARLGYTMNSTLLYTTAGIAFSNAEYTAVDNDGSDRSSGTKDFNDVGFVIGGGAERILTQSGIRLKIEGLYYKFDDKIDTSDLAPTDSDDGDFAKFEDIWSVRAGISIPLSK